MLFLTIVGIGVISGLVAFAIMHLVDKYWGRAVHPELIGLAVGLIVGALLCWGWVTVQRTGSVSPSSSDSEVTQTPDER